MKLGVRFANFCYEVVSTDVLNYLYIGPEDNKDDDGYTKVRNKRQAEQYEYTPTKTRCPLLLVADYRFYQEMGGSNTKTTINYLVRIYALLNLLNVHEYFHDRRCGLVVRIPGYRSDAQCS
jgi:hypothetical protein